MGDSALLEMPARPRKHHPLDWSLDHEESAKYLRRTMQIEPRYPLDLSILPEPKVGKAPDASMAKILQLAIFGSPQHRLSLEGI
jgi:hypothetical protein